MRVLIFILWILLGIFYWYCQNQCCNAGTDSVKDAVTQTAAPATSDGATKVIGDRPLTYNWSDGTPILGSRFNAYRDSIVSNVKENQILEITGLYSRDEENPTDFENLGLARADMARQKMNVNPDEVRLNSRLVASSQLDRDNAFESVRFKALVDSKNVKEETVVDENNNVQTRTTIYFPFNSTNKLNDSEVESYLDQVAKRVVASGEKVSLVGHTDNVGGDGPNMRLGTARANVIKNYLVRKGVNPSKVLVSSKGESKPIASNDTDSGRAKNRRTELQIIK